VEPGNNPALKPKDQPKKGPTTYKQTPVHDELKTAIGKYIASNDIGKMTKEEAERYIIKHCSLREAQFDPEGKQTVAAHPGYDTYERLTEAHAKYTLERFHAILATKDAK